MSDKKITLEITEEELELLVTALEKLKDSFKIDHAIKDGLKNVLLKDAPEKIRQEFEASIAEEERVEEIRQNKTSRQADILKGKLLSKTM